MKKESVKIKSQTEPLIYGREGVKCPRCAAVKPCPEFVSKFVNGWRRRDHRCMCGYEFVSMEEEPRTVNLAANE